jgi:methionyl-tRNA formyltransferase
MKMDRGMDTGDILLVSKTPITEEDNAQTLHDRLAQMGADLAMQTIEQIEKKTLTSHPQNNDQATKAPKLKKQDGLVHWEKDAVSLCNLARGLTPWPGAFTFFKSKRLRLNAVETANGENSDSPGEIARVTDHGIEVGTGNGRLVITELQPEGKKSMSASSFLAGHKMIKGNVFDGHPELSTPTRGTHA